jgi:hypothetical protein
LIDRPSLQDSSKEDELLDSTKGASLEPEAVSSGEPEPSVDIRRKLDYTVRTFAPEGWGQIDRFATFFQTSFPDATSTERRALSGVGNHFRKAMVLRALAMRITPTLAIDRQQLNEKGHTVGYQAIELAAVIENVFTELYSAVDCARKVLFARYRVRGMKDSTRKTFSRAQKGALNTVLPAEVLSALKEADWYDPLRVLRDELTHSNLGSVQQDNATGKVSYMHTGLGTKESALIIEDIFGRMEADIDAVNLFLGKLFLHMNTLLKDVPTVQVCGIHQGKVLLREIRREPNLTFDSGKCLAVGWIEVDGKPTCPLLYGAYWTAKAAVQA